VPAALANFNLKAKAGVGGFDVRASLMTETSKERRPWTSTAQTNLQGPTRPLRPKTTRQRGRLPSRPERAPWEYNSAGRAQRTRRLRDPHRIGSRGIDCGSRGAVSREHTRFGRPKAGGRRRLCSSFGSLLAKIGSLEMKLHDLSNAVASASTASGSNP
jgi:hypothetical protein